MALYFCVPNLILASANFLTTKLEEKEIQQSEKKNNSSSKELSTEELELKELEKQLQALKQKEKEMKKRAVEKKIEEKNKEKNTNIKKEKKEEKFHYTMNGNIEKFINKQDSLELTFTANTEIVSAKILENTRRCSLKGSLVYNNTERFTLDQFNIPLFKLLDESGKVIPSFIIALPRKKNYTDIIEYISFDVYIFCRTDENDLIFSVKTY